MESWASGIRFLIIFRPFLTYKLTHLRIQMPILQNPSLGNSEFYAQAFKHRAVVKIKHINKNQ